MNRHVPTLMFLLITAQAFSQAYMTAGGLRAGTDWGLTVQQRLSKATTLEGIVQSSLEREEVMVTLLAEQHYPVIFRGLNLYFGAGLHKGWLSESAHAETPSASLEDPFGVTLVGGAEITVGRLNISYDFKPSINVVGGDQTIYPQTGVSVRYIFLTNKVYKDRVKQKKKKKRAEEKKGIHIGGKWKFWKKKDSKGK